MARDYGFTADGRRFFAVKQRVRKILPLWEGKGNPMLWFSWEQKGDERHYLTSGVKTLYEAQRPIDKICGITG
jgi:hypothetical protein